MFRRLVGSLIPDPEFPTTLSDLGYHINEEDKIRKISNNDQGFTYKITNDERTNDKHRDAFNTACRNEILNRMTDLGYEPFYVPQFTTAKPQAPHITILTTPLPLLLTKYRVIVIINDDIQDLGIWSWRDISGQADTGLEGGSCVSFARELRTRYHDFSWGEQPGLIILNPGQLLYSWKQNRSMSFSSWYALPKSSFAHPPVFLHEVHNVVDGHGSAAEHVEATLVGLLGGKQDLREDAEIYFIGIGNGAEALQQFMQKAEYHDLFRDRVAAVQYVAPYFSDPSTIINEGPMSTLFEHRFRTLQWSGAPEGIAIGAPYHEHEPDADGYVKPSSPFLTTSTGELEGCEYTESVFPRVFTRVLDWFDEVAAALAQGGEYVNPRFIITEEPKVVTTVSDEVVADPTEVVVDSDEVVVIGAAQESEEMGVEVGFSELSVSHGNNTSGDTVEVAGVQVDRSLVEKAGLL